MLRLLLLGLSLLIGACSESPNPTTSACSSDSDCADGLQCMALSGCEQDRDGNGIADIVDACEAGGGYACDASFGVLSECLEQEGVLFCDRDLNGNGHPDLVDLGMYPDDNCSQCEPNPPAGCNAYCFTIDGETTMAATTGNETSDTAGSVGGQNDATPSDTSECLVVEAADTLQWDAENERYTLPLFNIGGPGDDILAVEFYGDPNATGAFNLASDTNANYETCTECVVVVQEAGQEGVTFFFQQSGTLTVSADSAIMNGQLTMTLESLTLREVTLEGPNGITSVPVAGGACLAFDSPLTLSTL